MSWKETPTKHLGRKLGSLNSSSQISIDQVQDSALLRIYH